jgi:hypothetical protein
MQVLFGPQLITTLENTLLPQCRAVIPVQDVKCKKLRNHNYGCKSQDMAIDVARLTTLNELRAVFAQVGTDQCFDFKKVEAQFAAVFDETPSTIVPYGIGTYTGIDQMVEYLGIFWSALNRNLWINGPGIPLGGQFSADGKTFTSQSGLTGAFALGQIAFGNPKAGQPIRKIFQSNKFEKCSTKIKTLEILPSKAMAFLASNFGYFVNDFDMWGVGNICEYHENICRPAGAATYTDYEDCLAQIGALPGYSAACGPNRPLAGNSLGYRPLAGNSLGCKFKHHFMAAIVPETHCKHIGPEYTPDDMGVLKALMLSSALPNFHRLPTSSCWMEQPRLSKSPSDPTM